MEQAVLRREKETGYKIRYPELVSFIREHGPDSYIFLGSDDKEIDIQLDWFLANKRIFIVRNKGRIIALCTFIFVESPEILDWTRWPIDNYDGQYLFIHNLVIHKNMKGRYGILYYMAKKAKQWAPHLRFLVYFHHGKFRIMYLNRLTKEVNNGRKTAQSTHAA